MSLLIISSFSSFGFRHGTLCGQSPCSSPWTIPMSFRRSFPLRSISFGPLYYKPLTRPLPNLDTNGGLFLRLPVRTGNTILNEYDQLLKTSFLFLYLQIKIESTEKVFGSTDFYIFHQLFLCLSVIYSKETDTLRLYMLVDDKDLLDSHFIVQQRKVK